MIFRQQRTRPVHWLRVALDRGQIAGRVRIGGFVGSGFVLDGAIVGEAWQGLPLFFSARHVIPGEFRSLPENVTVKFDALTDDPQGGTAGIERVLALSAQDALNYSVSLLDRWPGQVPLVSLCPQTPVPGDLVFILGFPGGRGLEISLHDNEVLVPPPVQHRAAVVSADDVLFHGAPTEGGSSGSPIFNADWELAAIQMGGDTVSRTNYGVRIHPVVADATRKLNDVVLEESVVARVKAARRATADYSSVFISYSHADSIFADRLFNSLRSAGVRAWYDKHNILPGYDIYAEISRGIREQDKVLFCFSDAALASGWVDAELDRALQKEREVFRAASAGAASAGAPRSSRSKTLIPLDLSGRLLDGRWDSPKAPDMMSRGIADFRNWENQSTFSQAFERLLGSLQRDAGPAGQ